MAEQPDIRTLKWQDFSAGWCPSDDERNGRKNALLQMNNVELDKNGAVQLSGGCTQVGSAYAAPIHSIYSNDINGSRVEYATDTSGNTYRNRANIATNLYNSSNRACFGTAFDYTLILDRNIRKKDTGSGTPVNLGVAGPASAPTLNSISQGQSNFLTVTSIVDCTDPADGSSATLGAGLHDGSGVITFLTPNKAGTAVMQTNVVGGGPVNYNSFGGAAIPTDNDFVLIDAEANGGDISRIASIKYDILLSSGGGSGVVVPDYYTQTWTNDGSFTGKTLKVKLRRSDFLRVGVNTAKDWTAVYGYRITVVFIGEGVSIVGLEIVPAGDALHQAIAMYGGSESSLQGTYQYMQLNVNNTGSYQAKSVGGPILTVPQAVDMQVTNITLINSTGTDPQINEVWLFRRGGFLDQWYRVKVLTSGFTTPFNDIVTDADALELDITVNSNLISIASSGVLDDVLEVIGPMENRWFYHTRYLVYPSDFNNPDLVDASLAIKTTGSNDEVFMWSKKVSQAAILVGTSHEVYLLTGTFQTLPDNSIDIYYRALGCKHPPVSRDAVFYDQRVYYLASDGWRAIDYSGETSSLVAPNTDRLYQKDVTAYGYTGPASGQLPGSVNYPCCIANNKLYCGITARGRIEVYDFTRKYWRNLLYTKGDITAITQCPDGKVTAVFSSDNIQRDIDIKSSQLIDGTTKLTVLVTSLFMDDGLAENRKDVTTIKTFFKLGSSETIVLSLINETGSNNYTLTPNTNPEAEPLLTDAYQLAKSFQFSFSGQVGAFTLLGVFLDYSPRPTPLTTLFIRPTNYGNARLKLMGAVPFVIDTLGNTVVFTPTIDNAPRAALTLSSTRKKTFIYQNYDHTYGIDYSYLVTGGPFEFYEIMDPDILDMIPIGRTIYQVGPVELFRYGKIKQVEIRLKAPSTNPINTIIYANDVPLYTQNLIPVANADTCYYIPTPKGIEGQVFKMQLVMSTNTYVYYIRILVSRSGKDTENEWITLPEVANG